MMFEFGSFNLINEFERASNEPNAEQLAISLAQLQPYPRVALIEYSTLLLAPTNSDGPIPLYRREK